MSEHSSDPTESNESGTGRTVEQSLRMFVPGLERPADREAVTDRLHRVQGVLRVSTEPESEVVTVTYDDAVTKEATVTAAIRDAGYAVNGSPGRRKGRHSTGSCSCGCTGHGPPSGTAHRRQ